MLARTLGLTLRGIEGIPVEVEVDLSRGLPSYQTVGLPDASVRESRERVVSALRNSGYDFPSRRVTVNLAPAGLPKAGAGLDLPVALGVLAASEQLKLSRRRLGWLGELALDGRLRPVPGVLPMALAARERGLDAVVVPPGNLAEARAAGLPAYGPPDLRSAAALAEAPELPEPEPPAPGAARSAAPEPDLSEVRGQPFAKRALELAAAGGHNLLMAGPPGSGKSMLARRLPGLLPELSDAEAMEVTRIHSACGLVPAGSELLRRRPFRAPHHSSSVQALVGGGSTPRPGEITLAHRGVLFLDELPEFPRSVLEALRQPLETGEVRVARARGAFRFPAESLLVAAMNPCPCGWLGHPTRACDCPPSAALRYRARVSGPLLDRVDLQIELGPVRFQDWAEEAEREEPSRAAAARVRAARERQGRRLGPGRTNASMTARETRSLVKLGAAERAFLEEASGRLGLSARGLDRLVRAARTAADLAGAERVERPHLAEVLQFRALDRRLSAA